MSDFGQERFAYRRYSKTGFGAPGDSSEAAAAAASSSSIPGLSTGPRMAALQELASDVAVAQRVAVYATELGGLTPTCVRKGWSDLRDHLITRARLVRAAIEESSAGLAAEDREQVQYVVDAVVRGAEQLPVAPTPSFYMGGSSASIPAYWNEPERFTAPGAMAVLGLSENTWIAYIALGIAIAPLGTAASVFLWGGLLLSNAGFGMGDYLLSLAERIAGERTGEPADLDRLHADHLRWVTVELRSVYRQLYTTHLIAKQTTNRTARFQLLMDTDPRLAPEPPAIWTGTFPGDVEGGQTSEMSLWVLGLLAAVGIGVLIAVDG